MNISGTRRPATPFGSAPACVRPRDDAARDRRLGTVDLNAGERPTPRPPAVRIGHGKAVLRKQARAAGGCRDGRRKPWLLPRSAVRKPKFDDRVVAEKA